MNQAKEKWILAGFSALIRGGVRAVSVEAIARQMGLTKGSFYHHFDNRGALLESMLAYWKTKGTEELIEQAELQQSASAKFRALSGAIFTQTKGDRVEAAIRAWAASDESARKVIEVVDQKRLSYVEGLFVEMGYAKPRARWRSEAFYRLVIGDFMWRALGEGPLEIGAQQELIELFLSP